MEGFTNHLIAENYSPLAPELQIQSQPVRVYNRFKIKLHTHIVKNSP